MSEITLFLCGDLMAGRGVDQVLPHSCAPELHERFVASALDYVHLAEQTNGPIARPVEHGYVWGDALALLGRRNPDARIVNLETSITTCDDAFPKGINYRMHPGNIGVLTTAGIDCCVLANNHVLDWGEGGLLETLDTLTHAGIRVAGAGRNLAAARMPAVLNARPGVRVLVFAAGTSDSGIPVSWAARGDRSGVHLLRDLSDATVADIGHAVEAAKRPGDIAIASIHWGGNWGYEIPDSHRHFAHALIDRARIDLVHGHSSHHPKAIETHRGRPILYGCGDFLDDYEGIRGYEEYRDDLVLMYFPTLDPDSGRLIRLEMEPLRIRNFRLSTPSSADRAWLCATLGRECRRFGHDVRAVDGSLILE
ncbi:MAG TPA: CapA family protein [Longimicrobiales bacterium]